MKLCVFNLKHPSIKSQNKKTRGRKCHLIQLIIIDLLSHIRIFQILYDDDIVEEEQLTEWFDRKGISSQLKIDDNAASTVRKAAAPFITWLREAEAESEEEE